MLVRDNTIEADVLGQFIKILGTSSVKAGKEFQRSDSTCAADGLFLTDKGFKNGF